MPVKIPKTKLWRAIRGHCLDCVSNSAKEVALCTGNEGYAQVKGCKLYPYRFGKFLTKAKEAQTMQTYSKEVTGD